MQKRTPDYDNVILDDQTKEYIVEKRLFPYIPFYIARYEKDILSGRAYGERHGRNGNRA